MRKVIFLLFIKVRAVMYFAQILGRVKRLQITLSDCVQFKIISVKLFLSPSLEGK